MIVCMDVDYRSEDCAVAAALAFDSWEADRAADARVVILDSLVSLYEPGAFYRRELPCLLAVLAQVPFELEALVIDGFVFLDPSGRPGLGSHLHNALGHAIPVVGVAKTPFRPATTALEVRRGSSSKPLWITSVGMDANDAAAHVRAMHGDHRVPTLLREVDQLCRTAVTQRDWRRANVIGCE